MPEFTLHLTGTASIPHLAERAFLKLSVTMTSENKQATADSVLTTAEHIENEIHSVQDRFANIATGLDPISHWSKTSLSSTSMWIDNGVYQYRRGASPRGKRHFKATIDFDIRFRDFAALGDFSAKLAGLDHCELQGIQWRLLPATTKSFEARLRKEAAADALRQARDYCKVLCEGDDTVKIVPSKLSNRNATSGYGGSLFGAQQMQMQRAPQTGEMDAFSFTPQECRMNLSVDIEFNVETKGLDTSMAYQD